MPYLGVDTSTSYGSVAVARPGAILFEARLPERAEHARDLLTRIDEMLRSAGLEIRAFEGIGVAVGPGSFTGVRVGMATAKGLGYALRVGVAGISTLEAVARAALRAQPSAGALCAALQAGRGEVYAALFRAGAGEPVRATPDRSYRPAVVAEMLSAGSLLAGDGAGAILSSMPEDERARHTLLDPRPALGGSIALWAAAVINPGSAYRPGSLGPNYVRPSDAEVARRRP